MSASFALLLYGELNDVLEQIGGDAEPLTLAELNALVANITRRVAELEKRRAASRPERYLEAATVQRQFRKLAHLWWATHTPAERGRYLEVAMVQRLYRESDPEAERDMCAGYRAWLQEAGLGTPPSDAS